MLALVKIVLTLGLEYLVLRTWHQVSPTTLAKVAARLFPPAGP